MVCIAESPKNTPRALGSRCGVRSPMRYGRYSRRFAPTGTCSGLLVHKVVFVYAHEGCGLLFCGAEVVTEPFQRQTGALGHAHHVPAVGNSRTAGVYSALGIHCHGRGVGEYHAGSADGGERLAVFDYAGAYRSGCIVAGAADNHSSPHSPRVSAISRVSLPVTSQDS